MLCRLLVSSPSDLGQRMEHPAYLKMTHYKHSDLTFLYFLSLLNSYHAVSVINYDQKVCTVKLVNEDLRQKRIKNQHQALTLCLSRVCFWDFL